METTIIRNHPDFDRLVPPGSELEIVAEGCTFTEGPVWNFKEKYLLWSDMPADRIRRWAPGQPVTIFRAPCGKSNGLVYDSQGRLLACEHANRRVSRTEKDGSIVSIATHFEGKKLNSPNDLVVRPDGSIYFTDPPFGLTAEFGVEGVQELPFCGVFRVVPGQEPRLLYDQCDRPNGLAFSVDGSRLYVIDSPRYHILVFDVRKDGSIAGGKVFAELQGEESGRPDGLKVDCEDRIYTTGQGGIHVLSPEGQLLGRVLVPERHSANLNWGLPDAKTIFITAVSRVYSLRVGVAGDVRR